MISVASLGPPSRLSREGEGGTCFERYGDQGKNYTVFLKEMRTGKMDLQTAKLSLVQKLLVVTNSSLIEKIERMLDKEMVVAYTVEGKPLTRAAYDKRLKKAEEQIATGKSISQEDLENEAANW